MRKQIKLSNLSKTERVHYYKKLINQYENKMKISQASDFELVKSRYKINKLNLLIKKEKNLNFFKNMTNKEMDRLASYLALDDKPKDSLIMLMKADDKKFRKNVAALLNLEIEESFDLW